MDQHFVQNFKITAAFAYEIEVHTEARRDMMRSRMATNVVVMGDTNTPPGQIQPRMATTAVVQGGDNNTSPRQNQSMTATDAVVQGGDKMDIDHLDIVDLTRDDPIDLTLSPQ